MLIGVPVTSSIHPPSPRRRKQVERDVDVAARSLGVGTDLFRLMNEILRDGSVHAGNADVEERAQKIATAIGNAQIELSVDRDFAQGDFAGARRERDSALEAGRPGSGEQLFRIGADAGRAVPA